MNLYAAAIALLTALGSPTLPPAPPPAESVQLMSADAPDREEDDDRDEEADQDQDPWWRLFCTLLDIYNGF